MIKELKVELQAAISRKTLSPEADRNQLSPKVRSHVQLNPSTREFKGLPARCSTASSDSENEYILPEELIDRMALTIRQGFAFPKKELEIFDGDSLETGILLNRLKQASSLMQLVKARSLCTFFSTHRV